MRKAKAIVLDSWAVVAYMEGENSGDRVAKIMADAHENKIPLKMSIINVGEVWYSFAKQATESEADHAISELQELGIEFIDADWNLTRIAAAYKSKNKMSYADCFAAALAKNEKADLVTGDKEFKQIERELKIHWLE